MHPLKVHRRKNSAALLCAMLVSFFLVPHLSAQERNMGVVRGVVQTRDGRGVGGFWLMMVNPELGMNYRKGVNPIGQFTFTEIYPGTYVFKISPYSYTVISPSAIEVKGGDEQDIKVIVARAPGTAGPELHLKSPEAGKLDEPPPAVPPPGD